MEFRHAGCIQLSLLLPSAARADCLGILRWHVAVSSYHCLAARIGDLHEWVGNLHVCKLQCFSSLRQHAKGLATYMFASCSASVHYGITQKGWQPTCLQAAVLQFTTITQNGWRPTCLQAAVLQFTTASRKRVGDLLVWKLQCFSSLCITAQGLVIFMFASWQRFTS